MVSRLDTLAKAVAAGISRRQALGWFGGGLLSLFGVAKARKQIGPTCETFCTGAGFTAGSSDFQRCVTACTACRNRTPPGVACNRPNGEVICCPSGNTCCAGTCCPQGRVCSCGRCGGCPGKTVC